MLGFSQLGGVAIGQIPSFGGALQNLLPSLYTNTNTFFTPKLTLYLKPSLFSNSQTFFTPKLTLHLLPGLISNTQTFYSETVSAGPVNLLPSLFTNVNSFFTPKLTLYLLPSLFTNTQTFYQDTLKLYLLPSVLSNGQSFFGPSVTTGVVYLLPDLFVNPNLFFTDLETSVIKPLFFTGPGHIIPFHKVKQVFKNEPREVKFNREVFSANAPRYGTVGRYA